MLLILMVVLALVLMFIGEQFENETKKEYIKQGYDWNKVILCSNLVAILSGLLSTFLILRSDYKMDLTIYLLVFATTITAYVSTQSLMTDMRILLINRKLLRVAYLSIYTVSLMNIILMETYRHNWAGLLLFTLLIIFMFFVSPIGASDIRLLAVGIPFAIAIQGYTAIMLLVLSLLLVALGMFVKRGIYVLKELPNKKRDFPDMYAQLGKVKFYLINTKVLMSELNSSDNHAVPVGPFIILPFLIYLITIPFSL